MSNKRKALTSVLVKPAGPDCNLRCGYCFYLEKGALFPAERQHRMNGDLLEATVRQVLGAGEPEVSFAWQGGEPTLMGVEFFREAIRLQRQHGRPGQTIGNGLQTNGLLIDDEWCRLLRDGRFLVGLSLDGPEHVHDRYRVTAGQQPTWQRVDDAARRMLEAGVEVNALVVLNDYSVRYVDEIYDYLTGLGLRFLQFIPCLEPDAEDPGHPAPFSLTPEAYTDGLQRLFDRWRRDFRGLEATVSIRWFDSVFATYVGLTPPECTLLPECGTYVVVEHNGDVFACDFYVEDAWRLGNVLEGDLAEMLNSPEQQRFGQRKADLPEACRKCRWLSHCQGGCPKERWGRPDGQPRSYFCEAYQAFFEHADGQYRAWAEAWLRQQTAAAPLPARPTDHRVGRNDPCPCGSGLKYKRCCGT